MSTYKRLDDTGLALVWAKVKAYVASQLADISETIGLTSTYDSTTHTVTLSAGVIEDADNTEY